MQSLWEVRRIGWIIRVDPSGLIEYWLLFKKTGRDQGDTCVLPVFAMCCLVLPLDFASDSAITRLIPSVLSSILVTSFYTLIPTVHQVLVSPALPTLFPIMEITVDVKWYFIIAVICIYLLISNVAYLKLYELAIYEREYNKRRGRGRQLSSPFVSLPKWLQQPRLDRVKAWSQELLSDLSHGWQRDKYLDHILLPSRVHVGSWIGSCVPGLDWFLQFGMLAWSALG